VCQCGLQLARATEGTEREKEKEQSERHGRADKPVSNVAVPGAQGGVEPDDPEYGKDCPDNFQKELP
jgi:hypothetical protein